MTHWREQHLQDLMKRRQADIRFQRGLVIFGLALFVVFIVVWAVALP